MIADAARPGPDSCATGAEARQGRRAVRTGPGHGGKADNSGARMPGSQDWGARSRQPETRRPPRRPARRCRETTSSQTETAHPQQSTHCVIAPQASRTHRHRRGPPRCRTGLPSARRPERPQAGTDHRTVQRNCAPHAAPEGRIISRQVPARRPVTTSSTKRCWHKGSMASRSSPPSRGGSPCLGDESPVPQGLCRGPDRRRSAPTGPGIAARRALRSSCRSPLAKVQLRLYLWDKE